jgi:hypothetical protein
VAEAGCGDFKGEAESIGPTARCPHLFGICDIGNMIVLDPGQMPHEPSDRICFTVNPKRQIVWGQTLDNAMHDAMDPAERVGEYT